MKKNENTTKNGFFKEHFDSIKMTIIAALIGGLVSGIISILTFRYQKYESRKIFKENLIYSQQASLLSNARNILFQIQKTSLDILFNRNLYYFHSISVKKLLTESSLQDYKEITLETKLKYINLISLLNKYEQLVYTEENTKVCENFKEILKTYNLGDIKLPKKIENELNSGTFDFKNNTLNYNDQEFSDKVNKNLQELEKLYIKYQSTFNKLLLQQKN